jgi:hypothetical protein
MLKKKLHWERSAITGRIIEENRCQAAQILPGTSIADMLLVFLLQEKKYLKKKTIWLLQFLKDKISTSDILVNTSMHKKDFQDHTIQVMMKKV